MTLVKQGLIKKMIQPEKSIETEINRLWDSVVKHCNKTLKQADIYGFQLMDIQDPDVHTILKTLDKVVIPTLDAIIDEFDFSPESGMKVACIKTYTLHLRRISIAISNDDLESFNIAIADLQNEAML